ncbi:transposase [Sinanaerobacter chloroacetimidivorans]|jgi:transposase|uniref:Transposase n=1 Tax=Sinanaerobacter chloroacetimidivorans TaxID=2818044 RepID=A0A8J8B3T0_9FIRM|nr:transposase [Sinanaerobacter chloroacetimidivorans]MBR0600654.1 transposase [Sinanaerobacter chloroacetimidivorans]
MTKFSKEFRMKLIKEVEQGESLNSVARKYGVGGATLKRWYSNFSHGGTKQLVSTKKHYTQEFKIYAIEYRWQHDLSYRLAAIELGIPNDGVLHQWEKRYLECGVSGLLTKKKGRPPKMPKKPEPPKRDLTREEQLEAEIAQLRMENAYLKKLNALVQEREKSKRKTK